jgi:two-component system, NarL family, response regulator DevR
VRILLVDDHQEVRAMLRVGMHRHAGLEVVGEAGSVKTALTVASETSPQAVVLDLHLPDAEPREAFDAIRDGLPEARVVIYSARETSRGWYEERGARFFGKGSDRIDELIEWLRAHDSPSP